MTAGGWIEHLWIESEVLRGNPLGDPSGREILIYLPPGYPQQGPYPTLYCLAGFTGCGGSLLGRGAWTEGLDQRMDRLIRAGCPPAVLVLPDCLTRYGGSQYMNSPAHGRYQDHLLEEVLPEVDRRFHTVKSRAGRGVLGKSSGGHAALRLGFFHGELFSAVACHSGDLYFEWSYQPDFPRFLNVVERAGGVAAFLAGFFGKPKHGSEEVLAMSVIAMAAAYSPSSGAPLAIEFPFDLHTGEMRPEVWRRWLDQDPLTWLERHADALRALKLLYVDCGRRDEYHLHFGARRFAARCRQQGIAIDYQEFDDDHRGTAYRYDVSVPLLVAALSRP